MSTSQFLINLYEGALGLYKTVASDPSLLWLLVPILVLWSATEVYYGEYAHEKFGFSSIFTGALSLLWLSFVTLRDVFVGGIELQIRVYGPEFWSIIALALYTILILYVSFKHIISEEALEIIASRRILYFASFLLIIFGVGRANIDFYAILSALVIFALVSLVFGLIKKYLLAGFLGEIEAVRKAGGS